MDRAEEAAMLHVLGAGPGHEAARKGRLELEEALFAIRKIAVPFDRQSLCDRILHAIGFVYAALDSETLALAHLEGLTQASAVAQECLRYGENVPKTTTDPGLQAMGRHLSQAAAVLSAGADAVAKLQFDARDEIFGGRLRPSQPPPRPFQASVGLPSLHALARATLLPHLLLDPEAPEEPKAAGAATLAKPKTLEELKAFAADAASGALAKRLVATHAEAAAKPENVPALLAFEPAVEEVEVLRNLGRDCLEDIANGRNLRKPNAIESYLDQAPFEQNLLNDIDAFAAAGGAALPMVSLFHAEAKSPDPERAFAVALSLGCIEGHDTVAAAVMTLKQSAPEELPGWAEGFFLAPNPAIDEAMGELCESRRPDLVGLALDVLHARCTMTDAVLEPLLARTEPEIACRVARALARVFPRDRAVSELVRLLENAPTDEVFLAACEALLRRQHSGVLDVLAHAVDAATSVERQQGALELLCFSGSASHLERLVAALRIQPTPRLVRAIGRFGHTDTLLALRDALEHQDEEIARAAAEALERVTGAGLREMVEEDWEIELPEEAKAIEGAAPIPKRKVERVVKSPETWRVWLKKNERKLEPGVRYRAGQPFSPMHIVDELESKLTPPEARADATRELAIVTGLAFRFSPDDWVARQKSDLVSLRAAVSALGFAPGAFGLARRMQDSQIVLALAPAFRPEEAAFPPLPADLHRAQPEPTAPPVPEKVQSPALPFQQPAVPAWAYRRPASVSVDETMPPEEPGVEPQVLPFKPVPAGRVVEMPASPPLAAPPRRTRTLLPEDDVTALEPLPFSAEPHHEDPLKKTFFFATPLVPTKPVLPFVQTPAEGHGAHSPLPELTLEMHAALCAELAASPAHADEIFAKYGLSDPAHRASVDAMWKERLRGDPKLYAEWQRAYRRALLSIQMPR